MARLIEVGTPDTDSLILDSFAGSGTTGHAVLAMNKADGGSRRFIMVEMDPAIARDITAQRLTRVIEGYHPGGDAAKEKVEGLGGGFRFCTLGKPLFDEAGGIDSEVKFADLAAHVFFTETGTPIPKRPRPRTSPHPNPLRGGEGARCSPLLGVHQGKAVYLLFNGVLGDRRPRGGNVLTRAIADSLALPEGASSRVVYGEASRLSAKTLDRLGITFRQVPFELKVD